MALTQIPLVLTLKNKVLRQLWPFDWVLGRHACLGFDVLRALGCDLQNFNFQKGRVDTYLNSDINQYRKINLGYVKGILARRDILDLIAQQKYLHCLPKHPPKFILLDSFTELTDQLFRNKKVGWKFCCNSEDLLHTKVLKSEFTAEGLLNKELIQNYYEQLINFFENKYPNVPIIFLHIPKKLESREYYIERNNIIRGAIKNLSLKNKKLFPIAINEKIVDWKMNPDGNPDYFPYHYNDETYIEYARIISTMKIF